MLKHIFLQAAPDFYNEIFYWYYQGKIYINNTKNKVNALFDVPFEIINVINVLPNNSYYILGKTYLASGLSRMFGDITN